jgi:hypothetical protein
MRISDPPEIVTQNIRKWCDPKVAITALSKLIIILSNEYRKFFAFGTKQGERRT